MTAYIRFLQNGMPMQGGVRTGAHAGWSELLGLSMDGRTSASRLGPGVYKSRDGGQTWASTPRLQVATLTKIVDASSSALMLAAANTYGGFTAVQPGATRQGGGARAFNVFDPAFRGGVSVGAAGSMPLPPAGEGKKATIHFCKTDKGDSAGRPYEIAAEVNFTTAGDRAADLRVVIHDVRVVRYRRTANVPASSTTNVLVASTYGRGVHQLSLDHIVIAYGRMTYAGAPSSAPDISQDVRGRLLVGSDQGVWRQAGNTPQGRLYPGTNQGVF